MISRQSRNEGGKGGHLPPGAALWGRQIEVGMLRIKYEISGNDNNYNLQNVAMTFDIL